MSAEDNATGNAPTTVEALVKESLSVISMPDIYIRLQEVLASENTMVDDIAKVVSLDPALAARLLRIANSAFYSFPSQVETVSRAVNILGIQKIHDLVLAASMTQAMDGVSNDMMDMHTFWYRSVHCGFMARELAGAAGKRNGESLFVRGLLHDIGHLILYSRFPDECRIALAEGNESLTALYQAERNLIGCDACTLTAELMASWKLPTAFVESTRGILSPVDSEEHKVDASFLHMAATLTHGMDTDLLLDQLIGQIDAQAWQLTGLSIDQVSDVVQTASEEVIQAMYEVFAAQDAA